MNSGYVNTMGPATVSGHRSRIALYDSDGQCSTYCYYEKERQVKY